MSVGPTPNKVFPLSKQELIIGRDTTADLVINIAEVSRRHARLRLEAGGFVIEDLGSTNGTFVNGQRMTGPTMLRPGDRIQLGEAVTLSYQVAQFDIDATVVTPASQQQAIPRAGQPAAAAPPPPPPSPAPAPPPAQRPAYAGHVPASPPAAPAVQKKDSRPWLWAGLGCAGVVVCVVVVGAIAFDMLNMYCTPPFDTLFSFLYTCP